MDETKRWAIALMMSLLLAFGGNYWMTTISQAKLDVRVDQMEQKVLVVERKEEENSRLITKNVITLNEVNQGWKTVAKAVEANTNQLTKFTEVLIRLEERDKLKKEI